MQGQPTFFGAVQNKDISDKPRFPAVIVVRFQYEDADGNFYWTDVCRYLSVVTNPGNTPGTVALPCANRN